MKEDAGNRSLHVEEKNNLGLGDHRASFVLLLMLNEFRSIYTYDVYLRQVN